MSTDVTQTSTAHTPGPWAVERDRSITAWTPPGSPCALPTITLAKVYSGGARSLAEADANARLIAAAPDLLTSLQQLVDALTGVTPSEDGNFSFALLHAQQTIQGITTRGAA